MATGLAIGFVAGGVCVGLLFSYPKGFTATRTYCTKCGVHQEHSRGHEVLGSVRSSSSESIMLTRLLALAPNDHEHTYVEPPAHVFPSTEVPAQKTPEHLQNTLLTRQLRKLEDIQESPQAVALLTEAMANDRDKTSALILKLLDPKRYYPGDVISILGRQGTWEERWAAIDAFDKAYKCTDTPQQVQCTLETQGKEEPVFELRADGTGRITVPSLRNWKP